jgi:UDP-N-acetylmuramoyl-tripeptide--D-alanyl-D-alanine ligase
MSLWSSAEAEAATGGRATAPFEASGLSIDSRSLAPGDLFVALRDARDGHDFAAAAFERGAAAALVSRVPEGLDTDDTARPLLLVEDVQAALEALGRAGRARTEARVLAITGSVGKTSTKDMAAHMLADQGRTHAAVRSFNNHWGVPLTLARMPRDAEFAVIEIGMNGPGEISPLAAMARPHAAIVTTVGPVHLEGFPGTGIRGIAAEKASIFSGLEPGGVAIWNADLGGLSGILGRAAPGGGQSFGAEPDADWRLVSVHSGADAVTCEAEGPDGPFLFRIGTPGTHFATNALALLAALPALGADPARGALALGAWRPPDGRGRRHAVPLGPDLPPLDLIDDAYNANPASVGAALALLADVAVPPRARRVAILGDMKELGPTGEELHRMLARHPAMDRIDTVHCVGPLMAALHEALPPERRGRLEATAEALAQALPGMFGPGDAVLVKGSLSMRMAAVVEGVRALADRRPPPGHAPPAPPTEET